MTMRTLPAHPFPSTLMISKSFSPILAFTALVGSIASGGVTALVDVVASMGGVSVAEGSVGGSQGVSGGLVVVALLLAIEAAEEDKRAGTGSVVGDDPLIIAGRDAMVGEEVKEGSGMVGENSSERWLITWASTGDNPRSSSTVLRASERSPKLVEESFVEVGGDDVLLWIEISRFNEVWSREDAGVMLASTDETLIELVSATGELSMIR